MKKILVKLINNFPRLKDIIQTVDNMLELNLGCKNENYLFGSFVIGSFCSVLCLTMMYTTIAFNLNFHALFFDVIITTIVCCWIVGFACFYLELMQVIKDRNDKYLDSLVSSIANGRSHSYK